MSSDTDIQQAYSRATNDAPAGPDLAEVLALGRVHGDGVRDLLSPGLPAWSQSWWPRES